VDISLGDYKAARTNYEKALEMYRFRIIRKAYSQRKPSIDSFEISTPSFSGFPANEGAKDVVARTQNQESTAVSLEAN
jgi:hypothetical protein